MSERYFKQTKTGDLILPITEESKERVKDCIFPNTYLIPSSYITPVKDQWSDECWAFSHIAMLETKVLREGFDKTDDLSVAHLIYSTFDIREKFDTPVNNHGLLPIHKDGDKVTLDYGGNRLNFQSYAALYSGVAEELDPYYLQFAEQEFYSFRPDDVRAGKPRNYQINEMLFLEDEVVPGEETFINIIKFSLMQYGAVTVTINYSLDYKKAVNTADYPKTASYYVSENDIHDKNLAAHSVLIVGWDDNFPAELFAISPSSPGAFRIKNSHGTSENDDGYLWVSYENVMFSGAACITSVSNLETKNSKSNKGVYTKSYFGTNDYYPIKPGATTAAFIQKFNTTSDERVTAIGVCNYTPCFLNVRVTVNGDTLPVLENQYLKSPGFHRIEMGIRNISGENMEFTVEYTASSRFNSVFIPMESKADYQYENLDIKKADARISINGGEYKTVAEINQEKDEEGNNFRFGSPVFYVYTSSKRAANIRKAYKDLTLPATKGFYLYDLPTSISENGENIEIDWRVEPYLYETYCGHPYSQPVKEFKTDGKLGLINTGEKSTSVIITAVLAKGDRYQIEKSFLATLDASKQIYDFDCEVNAKAHTAVLSGKYGIDGAKVYAKCNNTEEYIATVKNGVWKIDEFPLYDPNKGWKDEYENSTVQVFVKDDNNLFFCSGQCAVKLNKPFSENIKDNAIYISIGVGAGAVVFVGAIVYAWKTGKLKALKDCVITLASGFRARLNGYVPLPDNMNVEFHGVEGAIEKPEVTFESGILADVGPNEMDGLVVRNVPVSPDNTLTANTQTGCFFRKMPDGAVIKNCKFYVTDPSNSVGAGIFYEGSNVNIENSEVNVQADGRADFCGIAHTLTGTIKNCRVSCTVNGQNLCGVANDFSGNIDGVAVDMKLNGSGDVFGLCGTVNNATVSNSTVYGNLIGGSKAAGFVGTMNGGTVSDVRISGDVICTADNGVACGVACEMTGEAKITRVVSVGKLDGGTKGSAYGISVGQQDKPQSISNCFSINSFIKGAKVGRISAYECTNCVGFSGTVFDSGVTHADRLSIVTAAELLNCVLFVERDFDTTNTWQITEKKKHIVLRNSPNLQYDYPFPNPYLTETGKYIVKKNEPFAVMGAATVSSSKIGWRNLSPEDGVISSGSTRYMLKEDNFYLEFKVALTEAGTYSVEIYSQIDGSDFTNKISIEAT